MTIKNPDQQPAVQRSSAFHSMVRLLTWCGIFVLLGSGLILFGGLTSGFSNVQMVDLIFNIFFAALFFVCARVLARGSASVIWLFGTAILLSLLYSFVMGRGLNFIILLVGSLLIWRMYVLKQNRDIS